MSGDTTGKDNGMTKSVSSGSTSLVEEDPSMAQDRSKSLSEGNEGEVGTHLEGLGVGLRRSPTRALRDKTTSMSLV